MVRGDKGHGRHGRWRATALGVFAAVLWLAAGGLLAAPAAEAAAGHCPGRVVRTLPLPQGEVRVYKSRTRACAVAVASRPGGRRPMAVSIQPRGGVPVRNAGRFTRYAGPVAVGAINRCVYVRGSVAGGSADSGWILC